MQIKCEYCDSVVEINNDGVCPYCCAPLGESLDAALEKKKAEDTAKYLEEQRRKEKEDNDELANKIIDTALGVAGATFASRTGRKIIGSVIRNSIMKK